MSGHRLYRKWIRLLQTHHEHDIYPAWRDHPGPLIAYIERELGGGGNGPHLVRIDASKPWMPGNVEWGVRRKRGPHKPKQTPMIMWRTQ